MPSVTQVRTVTTPALDAKTPRKVAFFSYVISGSDISKEVKSIDGYNFALREENDDYSKILGEKTNNFQVYFNTQIVNKIVIISNYLVICSNIGNKIHIFDINHFQFKYCLY